jgi:hypothetical protein
MYSAPIEFTLSSLHSSTSGTDYECIFELLEQSVMVKKFGGR